ncbi:MAG TPA: FAD-linked oxidase C-terminal domain-containing protein [Acidimicrobiales bacterium]|nr:FAD-linked oxidase C-terminal domain-containing protein [Acidimicrobiales bacterium]
MSDIVEQLRAIVGDRWVLAGATVPDDYTHDESLTAEPASPLAVVRPANTAEVAAILRLADEDRVPVVARGSGTGLSGACVPVPGCLLVAFDRMQRILEVDTQNHVAVVEPGVTLAQLDEALAPHGLFYSVAPGESSASVGGNVGTNAGGMRAIRYGVTRHNVLGLEAVLAGGEVIRTGGKFVKSSAGYDLTQLLVGSEGTLALVTEVTVKLQPRPVHVATLLAPFDALRAVTEAVPRLMATGVAPLVLEYLDAVTMAGVTRSAGVELAIPDDVQQQAVAYLLVVLESTHEDRLLEDVEEVGGLLTELGALDVYVLQPTAGAQLISARERAFYVAKAAGADDILDVVVPRAAMTDYLAEVGRLAGDAGAFLAVCGHVGDGNVHISVFLADPDARHELEQSIIAAGLAAGGAISGEHGIGTAKLAFFTELEDPVKLELQRRIKAVFDPHGILGPGRLLQPLDHSASPQ